MAHEHLRASRTSRMMRPRCFSPLELPRRIRWDMSLNGPIFVKARFTTSVTCQSGTSWAMTAKVISTYLMLGSSSTAAARAYRCFSSSLAVSEPGLLLMRILKPTLPMRFLALIGKASRSVALTRPTSMVYGKWNGNVV